MSKPAKGTHLSTTEIWGYVAAGGAAPSAAQQKHLQDCAACTHAFKIATSAYQSIEKLQVELAAAESSGLAVPSGVISVETPPMAQDTPTLTRPAVSIAGDQSPTAGGKMVGNFQLLNLLGTGGMGVVYRAHDTKLNRIVAVKKIRTGESADPVEVARFRAEALAAASLIGQRRIGVVVDG